MKQPVLIFVNPKSGTKKSKTLYQDLLLPSLKEHDLKYEVVVTEYRGHALEKVKNMPNLLQSYSGIVSISGDGVVFEIYNGLYQRQDWNEVSKIPIGLIPGGSGCALHCSLMRQLNQSFDGLNQLGPNSALKNVIQGTTFSSQVPVDILEVELEDGNKVASTLGVTFGVIADSDINSEWLRCFGFMRAYFYVAWRVLFPSPTFARVSYVPLKLDSQGTPIPVSSEDPALKLPSIRDSGDLGENWVTEENHFHIVYALNLSTLDPVTVMSPSSKIGDGVVWLVIVRADMSTYEVLKWFMALDKGPDCSNPSLDLIPIRAFRFEPLDVSDPGSDKRVMSIDAESVTYGKIQGQVLPQKGRIMAARHSDSVE